MQPQKFSTILKVALTIFLLSLTLAPTAWAAEYKVLYKFQGYPDAANPYSSLIFDAAGNLYGTTYSGGANQYYGTAFKLKPNPDGSWSENVIHSFNGWTDGSLPLGGLIFDAAGNLYGTTWYGGWYDAGTVFQLTPNPDGSWTETVLHHFPAYPSDGIWPRSGLLTDAEGNLYGTLSDGGGTNHGAVFMLAPGPGGSWGYGVLSYDGNLDYPYADLVLDANGNLYGTGWGPWYAEEWGGVFKLSPLYPPWEWTCTVLHSFDRRDGARPTARLIFDAAGNLFGTTSEGGPYNLGTAFKLTANPDGSWKRTKLHVFKGPDGAHPYAGLIFDAAGNLYGTTANGGAYDGGTVFKLAPQPDGLWKLSKLHSFKGHHPYAGLVMDAAGNLYGTTTQGGLGYGVVFKITP